MLAAVEDVKTKTRTKSPLTTSSTRKRAGDKALTQRTGVRAGGYATWENGPCWWSQTGCDN